MILHNRKPDSADRIIMINSRSASNIGEASSFLAGLDQPATDAIIAGAQIRLVSAKHSIITQDHRATHLFLLQRGQVHYYHLTEQGDSVLLGWLAPGDVIGLVTLLQSPSAYMATAEATTDCELLVWEHSVIRNLASHYPLVRENSLRIALDYLRTYVERHIGLVTKTAGERLAETLSKLSDRSGEVHPDGIEIQATNDQLGALADVSPFTTSRILNNWMRAGILSKKRGRVIVYSPEALMVG
jgi:CRP-like cAMP-binding protein